MYIAGMRPTNEALDALLSAALSEDIGTGDHSTISCIPPTAPGAAVLRVKQTGILAGMAVAERVFRLRDPDISFTPFMRDGEWMDPGQQAFRVDGRVHDILACERVVLNCMQRMSGIATLTATYVEQLTGYHTRILDTRKTTPNFRLLEKEAVRIGGGINHRFGLYDMIMLKDNHIDFAGGIPQAIDRAWDYVQHMQPGLKIEIETRDIDEVRQVLEHGVGKVFRIMLDNFTPERLREALRIIDGVFETEASGGINLENIRAYADTGVDFVSVGALIHQARSLDLSLKAI
jgi:nicotinate-nucleotide pyrophosphorylase (carboxylating)